MTAYGSEMAYQKRKGILLALLVVILLAVMLIVIPGTA
jgi:hypothetical protein